MINSDIIKLNIDIIHMRSMRFVEVMTEDIYRLNRYKIFDDIYLEVRYNNLKKDIVFLIQPYIILFRSNNLNIFKYFLYKFFYYTLYSVRYNKELNRYYYDRFVIYSHTISFLESKYNRIRLYNNDNLRLEKIKKIFDYHLYLQEIKLYDENIL